MQHLNKKLINYFINNSFNNDFYPYKDKNNIYFIRESKYWREIVFEKRVDSSYECIARIEINSDKSEGYHFVRKISIENNIKYFFNLILLNRAYKYN